MSMLGTGAAASIAQSSLQSSQIASQRDKKANDTAHQVERQRDVDEIHLFKVLEQRDTDETSARVNVDEQNDPHQQNCPEQGRNNALAKTGIQSPGDPGTPNSLATEEADQPLYRHLDIKA